MRVLQRDENGGAVLPLLPDIGSLFALTLPAAASKMSAAARREE